MMALIALAGAWASAGLGAIGLRVGGKIGFSAALVPVFSGLIVLLSRSDSGAIFVAGCLILGSPVAIFLATMFQPANMAE